MSRRLQATGQPKMHVDPVTGMQERFAVGRFGLINCVNCQHIKPSVNSGKNCQPFIGETSSVWRNLGDMVTNPFDHLCWVLFYTPIPVLGEDHQPKGFIYQSFRIPLLKVGWPFPIKHKLMISGQIFRGHRKTRGLGCKICKGKPQKTTENKKKLFRTRVEYAQVYVGTPLHY